MSRHGKIMALFQQCGRYARMLGLLCVVCVLTRCASGDEARLRGVVAAGAPIVGARVTIKGSSGDPLTTATDAHGVYTINVGTLTPPYVLEASGGTVRGVTATLRLHSVATDTGVANITPLTELLVARLVQADPTTYFTTLGLPGGPSSTSLTDAGITTAQAAVVAQLRALASPVDVSTTGSFISTTFSAVAGDPVDAKLEAVQQALTASNTTLAVLVARLANIPGGGAPCSGTFGSLAATFTGVTLGSETLRAALFCPAQPRVTVSSTEATQRVYTFDMEAAPFTTLGGQRPTQVFSLTVNAGDGTTLRSLTYSLATPSNTLQFTVDCTTQRTACAAGSIAPSPGGTADRYTITLHDVLLPQAPTFPGGAAGPGDVTLSGTLVTAP